MIRIYKQILKFFYIDVEEAICDYNRRHPLTPIKNRKELIKCIIKS